MFFFFSELVSRQGLGDRNFPIRKIRKSVEKYFFDRIGPKFEHNRNTWYLHKELIPLVLFSPMTQEEEKESVRHRFPQVENADVHKSKSDFKLAPPLNTQIFDSNRPA